MTNKAIVEADDNVDLGEIKKMISRVGYNVIGAE